MELDIKKTEVGLDGSVVRSMLVALTEDLVNSQQLHDGSPLTLAQGNLTPSQGHTCTQHTDAQTLEIISD